MLSKMKLIDEIQTAENEKRCPTKMQSFSEKIFVRHLFSFSAVRILYYRKNGHLVQTLNLVFAVHF